MCVFRIKQLLTLISVLVLSLGYTLNSKASEKIRMVRPSNACHATFQALAEIGATEETKDPGAITMIDGALEELQIIPISTHTDDAEYHQEMFLSGGRSNDTSKIDTHLWKHHQEFAVAPGEITTNGLYSKQDLQETADSLTILRNSMDSEDLIAKVIFGKQDILNFISNIKIHLVQELVPTDEVGEQPDRELAFPEEIDDSMAVLGVVGIGSGIALSVAVSYLIGIQGQEATVWGSMGGFLMGNGSVFLSQKRNDKFLDTHLLLANDYLLEPRLQQIEELLIQTGKKARTNRDQRIYFELESQDGVKISVLFDNHVTPQLGIYATSDKPHWWQDTLADSPSTKQTALPVASKTPRLLRPKISLKERKQLFKKALINGYAKSIDNLKRRFKSNEPQIKIGSLDIETFRGGIIIKDLSGAPVIRITTTVNEREQIEVYKSFNEGPKQWINIDRLMGKKTTVADILNNIQYFEAGFEEPEDF